MEISGYCLNETEQDKLLAVFDSDDYFCNRGWNIPLSCDQSVSGKAKTKRGYPDLPGNRGEPG